MRTSDPGNGRGGVWRLAPLAALHWHRWGDDWVVYDAGSGDTHRMDTLAAVALGSLESRASNLAELAEQVSMDLEISDKGQLVTILREVVERLGKLGLIEPITP